MKLKALSLIAGVVAVTLTTVPLSANAQMRFNRGSMNRASFMTAQNQAKPGYGGKFERLGLSDTQRTQIQAIMQEGRAAMANVLTPTQRQQLEAAKQSGNKRGVWRELNLTEAQRTQMRQIKESQKQRINAVLTEEQRQQLAEMKGNRGNRENRRQLRNR